jgi:uncharacterized protein YbaR (Trm112 family)
VLVAHLEALRCPASHAITHAITHAASPLIAAVTAREGDDVRTATLGCPVCGAEYPVRDGWVILGDLASPRGAARPTDDDLMRAGALLGLSTPGGVVVLAPSWAEYAHPLVALTDVAVVVVGPPAGFTTGDGVSALAGTRALPFAPTSCRAVALDAWVAADADVVASWLAALRPRGRVVATADVAVPHGVREIARDGRHWVAERDAVPTSVPVPLARSVRP